MSVQSTKKDDKCSVDNYRPISLLSSVGKTMEKLVHKHVHKYLLENSIITSFQSGFTAGESSVNQLLELYNTFCQAWTKAKRFVPFSVILVKPSTGSGIEA